MRYKLYNKKNNKTSAFTSNIFFACIQLIHEFLQLGKISTESPYIEEETGELLNMDNMENTSIQNVEDDDTLTTLGPRRLTSKPNLVLNQPTINLIDTELGFADDVEEARPLDEYPTVSIETNTLINRPSDLHSQTHTRSILFAPVYKTEEFDQDSAHELHGDDNGDLRTTIETSVTIDDCTIKVGITNYTHSKLNMASINETDELPDNSTKTNTTQPLRNFYESASENININLNSFAHGTKDITETKHNRYALPQQIYELSNQNTEFCQEIHIDNGEQINPDYQEEETNDTHEQVKKISKVTIENAPNMNEVSIPEEECSELTQDELDSTHDSNDHILIEESVDSGVVSKTRVLSKSDLIDVEEDQYTTVDLGSTEIKIETSNCVIDLQKAHDLSAIERVERADPFNMPVYNEIIETTTEVIHTDIETPEQYQTNITETQIVTQTLQRVQPPILPFGKETQSFIPHTDDWQIESADELEPDVSENYLQQNQEEDSIEHVDGEHDKKLLLWLNYPKTIHLDSELNDETRLLDEKLDFLYENMRVEDSTISDSQDQNIINIERVLSYFISNQEEIADAGDNVLNLLPQMRPELHQVILNKQFVHFDLETQNMVQINTAPLELNNPCEMSTSEKFEQVDSDQSVRETEEYTQFNASSNMIMQFLEEQRVFIENTQCFTVPVQSHEEADLNEEFRNDDFVQSNAFSQEISITEEPRETTSVRTTLVLNAPQHQNLNEEDYSVNDEFQHEFVESTTLNPTLLAQENDLAERTSVRTTLVLNAPYNRRINPNEDTEIPIELSGFDRSANATCKHIETPMSESVFHEEVFHTEHLMRFSGETNNPEWLSEQDFIEPRTSTSLEMEPKCTRINYNCDLKSITSYFDEEDLEENSEIKPAKNEYTTSFLNAIEQFDPNLNTTDETTLSIDSDDECLGSFMEQIEKFEVISNDHVQFVNSSCANVMHHTIEEARTMVKLNPQCANVRKEGALLNVLAEQLELPKWEQSENLIVDDRLVTKTDFKSIEPCFNPIEIKIEKAEIEHDDESSSSSSTSSSNVHLIESVEVITQHSSNVTTNQHIHKVDTNRLKIREKQSGQEQDDSRFKVNFKKEELVDLREISEGLLDDSDETHTSPNKKHNQKEFAKKFVSQIIHLSSSKLLEIEQSHDDLLKIEHKNNTSVLNDASESVNEHSVADEDKRNKDESLDQFNFNKMSTKTTSEILESLAHLKTDIIKHLTDDAKQPAKKSACCPGNRQESEVYDPNYVLYENEYEEDDEDSLKFSNRLHSSSNYGHANNYTHNEYEPQAHFSSSIIINQTRTKRDEDEDDVNESRDNNLFVSAFSPIRLLDNSLANDNNTTLQPHQVRF